MRQHVSARRRVHHFERVWRDVHAPDVRDEGERDEGGGGVGQLAISNDMQTAQRLQNCCRLWRHIDAGTDSYHVTRLVDRVHVLTVKLHPAAAAASRQPRRELAVRLWPTHHVYSTYTRRRLSVICLLLISFIQLYYLLCLQSLRPLYITHSAGMWCFVSRAPDVSAPPCCLTAGIFAFCAYYIYICFYSLCSFCSTVKSYSNWMNE